MMQIPFRILPFLGLVFGALPASAGTADDVVTAFRQWTKDFHVKGAAVVVLENGLPVGSLGLGMDADRPVELASLSKAITGHCVSAEVKAGRLAYSDRLKDLLGWTGDLGGISVSELLTQTSGLGNDVTQKLMGGWLDDPSPHWQQVAKTVRKSGKVGPKTYIYNNVNYAILGLVIEASAGAPYPQACARLLGGYPSAKLSGRTGGFAPWGGWQMTLADYANFALKDVKPDLTMSPAAPLGSGAYYGPGMLWRRSGSGVNAWHMGLHCFPGRLEAGSYFASWNGPWTVAVAYRGCLSDKARDELDARLATAAIRR